MLLHESLSTKRKLFQVSYSHGNNYNNIIVICLYSVNHAGTIFIKLTQKFLSASFWVIAVAHVNSIPMTKTTKMYFINKIYGNVKIKIPQTQ